MSDGGSIAKQSNATVVAASAALLVFAAWAGVTAWQVSKLRTELEDTVVTMVRMSTIAGQIRHAQQGGDADSQRATLQAAARELTSLKSSIATRSPGAAATLDAAIERLRPANRAIDPAGALDKLDSAVKKLRARTAGISRSLGGYWRSLYVVLALSLVLGFANVVQLVLSRRVARRLAEEVQQRRAAESALLRTNDDLKRANRELDAFAAAAAHDLKEPLSSIQQCALFMQDADLDSPMRDQQEMLAYIAQSAQRLDRLVVALFAYARAGTPLGDLDVVPLAQPLTEARRILAAQIKESGATITAGDLPEVRGDAGQLTVLFQNALSNAIKYRSEAAPVIEIRATTSDADHVIEIADNGVGIAEADRERVFGAFERAGEATKNTGAGIGLSTLQRIVENHGGRAWLSSEPAAGTTLSFTLPRLKP